MAGNSVILKDGRRFPILVNICGGFIKAKHFNTSLRDQTAMFIDKTSTYSIEKITLKCGDVEYELDELEPGYYIRDGEKLLHKKI